MTFRPILTSCFQLSLVVFVVCAISNLAASASAPHGGRKLLVILLDGFRWNYFDKFSANELAGFNRLRSAGVSAGQLIPVFPSLSFPNYYSAMTGLYAESHGMIDNYMWDEKHDTEFLIGENDDQYWPYWWDEGEPLWITAKNQGKNSSFWYWCGCEVEIRGFRPNFCQPYLSSPNPSFQNFTEALDAAVEVLRNGSSELAGVYMEAVDVYGHSVGPNGVDLLDIIKRVDDQLARIQTVLETTRFPGQSSGSMFDRVNMAVFSDHGMKERVGGHSDNTSAVIRLFDYVNRTDYNRTEGSTTGPILSIWPNNGQTDWLYNRLKGAHPHLTVYKKADIPEKYHIKNHYRVPPIYCVADFGYVIIRNSSTVVRSVGYHGYDPIFDDMRGIFFARGPDFKKNFSLTSLPNVDLYAMFCNLLDLQPSANNGSLSPVCQMLSDPMACAKSNAYTAGRFCKSQAFTVLFLSLIILLCINF